MEERKQQKIDRAGKLKLMVALCEGKIDRELYELTAGESLTESLKELWKERKRERREPILEREEMGLITGEERDFILGKGPEPREKRKRKRKANVADNRKSAKEWALGRMNNQTWDERAHRLLAGRYGMRRETYLKQTKEDIERYEKGDITKDYLEFRLGNRYVWVLKGLYETLLAVDQVKVMAVVRHGNLSQEERDEVFAEGGEDDGGEETAHTGRDAEAGGGADG